MTTFQQAQDAAEIVRDAGGKIVGRTRLQKVGYILAAAGLEDGFTFEYKHYGPFSEDLAQATQFAGFLDLLSEVEQPTQWGGTYSIYTAKTADGVLADHERSALARFAAQADAIELELAATAVFLSDKGYPDPWAETERRKPEKAESGRLEAAKQLYRQLMQFPTPRALPDIA